MDIRHVAEAYVDECFVRETPPRVSELAHLLGMSRAHLTVLFARQIRESPSAWLKRMQIERSVDLMQTTDHSLTRIGTARPRSRTSLSSSKTRIDQQFQRRELAGAARGLPYV